MNLLIVHNRYQQPGGEDAVCFSEKALLSQNGHQVEEFIDHNDRIGDMSRLSAAVQTVWSRSSHKKLTQRLDKEKPDLVHFHNTFLLISPAAYYACKKKGIPVVQTLHNYRLLCPGATLLRAGLVCEDCLDRIAPWPGILYGCYRDSRSQTAATAAMLTFHRLLKTWQKQVDVFIALTDFARRKFSESGLEAEKIAVKPNFVYPDPGAGEGRGNYVLFAGRMAPEKGVRTLLKSWRLIHTIPLKIVGDGPLMDEARRFVRDGQLDRIELLGRRPREEVLALMKDARFLVFPSEWYEGFPVTIAEAFACGVPVIASRLGAMQEIVKDLHTGLHFTPSDSEDLAERIIWAWDHQEEVRRMGQSARREYEQKYTPEKNYGMLMDIYRQAIETARH